ncbi:hypothetical protein MBLNU459_g5383t1 [Dothideomycetes sp. NU459]
MVATRGKAAARALARNAFRAQFFLRKRNFLHADGQVQSTKTSTNALSQEKLKKLRPQKVRTIKDTFPFFRLPGEIRNEIYKYALAEPGKIHFLDCATPPPLAGVCRQMRRESLPFFISTNEFYVIFWKDGQNIVTDIRPETRQWLQDVGSDAPLFRHLHFVFDCEHELRAAAFVLDSDSKIPFKHDLDCTFCNGAGMSLDVDVFFHDLPYQTLNLFRAAIGSQRTVHNRALGMIALILIGRQAIQPLSVNDVESAARRLKSNLTLMINANLIALRPFKARI